MVLEVGIDPLDKLAKPVDFLAVLRCHPAAPLLHALRFPSPLAQAVGKCAGGDVVALSRYRSKYLYGAGRMLRQGGDVLAGSVMGVDQKCFRSLTVAADHIVHHRNRQTRIVAPVRHLKRYDDALIGRDRDLRVVGRADRPVGKPHVTCLGIAERGFRLGLLRLVLRMSLRSLLPLGPQVIEGRPRPFGALLHSRAARSCAARLRREEASGSAPISALSAVSCCSTAAPICASLSPVLNDSRLAFA